MNKNNQKFLFRVEIVETYPSDQNTADLKLIGRGRNDKDYAIKTLDDGNGFIPASELFCYELARLVSIPTPEYEILKMLDDTLAFGSVWRGDAKNISSQTEISQLITSNKTDRKIFEVVSKIYGLDLFVNNIDRHFGNYLFSTSYNKRKTVLAFDFSRAWLEVNFSGLEVLQPTERTYQVSRLLKDKKLLDIDISISTLENIKQTPQEKIQVILEDLTPKQWIEKKQIDSILNWWGSDDFISRLEHLKKEARR